MSNTWAKTKNLVRLKLPKGVTSISGTIDGETYSVDADADGCVEVPPQHVDKLTTKHGLTPCGPK